MTLDSRLTNEFINRNYLTVLPSLHRLRLFQFIGLVGLSSLETLGVDQSFWGSFVRYPVLTKIPLKDFLYSPTPSKILRLTSEVLILVRRLFTSPKILDFYNTQNNTQGPSPLCIKRSPNDYLLIPVSTMKVSKKKVLFSVSIFLFSSLPFTSQFYSEYTKRLGTVEPIFLLFPQDPPQD